MAVELAFETLLASIESTRGTAIAAPTHLIHLGGSVTPTKSLNRPAESRGVLAEAFRTVMTRTGATFEITEGPIDTSMLPFLLNGILDGNVTAATTPSGATNTRDWAFVRTMASDNLESYTLWFGDSSVRQLIGAYAMFLEATLSNDASAEDGVLTFSGNGECRKLATNNPADSAPAAIAGAMLPGQMMSLWIDTSSAFGTTAVTGRLVSASHTLRTGVTFKYLGGGDTATLDFSRTGRSRVIGITTTIVMELPDFTQYDQWLAHDIVKVRVRHNGAVIESGFNHYVQVDTAGPFEALSWGTNADSNRTVELTIEGTYDSTLTSDCQIVVRNARTAL
jgi:hypothetical protein